MNQWEMSTVEALPAVADAVIQELLERQDGGFASVLALHGDLGAGKTTFTQALAQQLGVSETVVSPTFVVMKSYDTAQTPWATLTHIDAYRIETLDEMRPLHFGAIMEDSSQVVVIEWAERIAALLPAHTLHLRFAIAGESRTITLDERRD